MGFCSVSLKKETGELPRQIKFIAPKHSLFLLKDNFHPKIEKASISL